MMLYLFTAIRDRLLISHRPPVLPTAAASWRFDRSCFLIICRNLDYNRPGSCRIINLPETVTVLNVFNLSDDLNRAPA
jgi:hypothetical protein